MDASLVDIFNQGDIYMSAIFTKNGVYHNPFYFYLQKNKNMNLFEIDKDSKYINLVYLSLIIITTFLILKK